MPKADDYAYKYRQTGYRIGQTWGYEIDYSNGNGYFNSQEEIDKSGLTYVGKSPRPGDFIYIDQNSDNIIDEKDIVPIGESTIPQIAWGQNCSLSGDHGTFLFYSKDWASSVVSTME